MHRNEKNQYFLQTEESLDDRRIEVCRAAWMIVYDVTDYCLRELISDVKAGKRVLSQGKQSNKRMCLNEDETKALKGRFQNFPEGNNMNNHRIVDMATLPQGKDDRTIRASAWMQHYFNNSGVGNFEPYGHAQITLDLSSRKEIYDDYKAFMESLDSAALTYSAFLRLWNSSFSHVRLFPFKQVSPLAAYTIYIIYSI